MDFPSFTFEFFEHCPPEKRTYWLNDLATREALIEQLDKNVFRVACPKPKVHVLVGWAIFQTSLSKYGRVIAVAGGAEMRASLYKNPETLP
jgi:hypothetical protein